MRKINADALKAKLFQWFPRYTLDGVDAGVLFAQLVKQIDETPTEEEGPKWYAWSADLRRKEAKASYEASLKDLASGYEPPITVYIKQIAEQVTEAREDAICTTIREQYAINVDREELIKALNYDRGQYNKGVNDGYKHARELYQRPQGEWIIHTDGERSEGECSECHARARLIFGVNYCPHCGAKVFQEPAGHCKAPETKPVDWEKFEPCPFTGKPCEEHNCAWCQVEQREREAAGTDQGGAT